MGWFDKAQYWMGRGMIKLDPTPGNVVVTKALPWYHRNIEQPWASTFARPVRLMFDPKMLAEENKYSSWEQAQRALNPWSAQRRKEYESWKSPWGVKGALEMSTPTNLIPMAAGPSVVAKGATVAAKGATKMGATRAAAGLTKTANVAAKTAKVVSTVENLPGKAIGKGVGMAGQGVRKAIRPPKPITRTATGIITTPEGMEFKGAMKGMETGEYARPAADNWTKKPWQKPEGKQPWDDLTGQDRYSVQSEAVDNIPNATIDDGLEHSREWWRAKKLEAAGIEPNSQLWKQEINLTGYRLKRGETWRDLVMRKVERMEEIHGPKAIQATGKRIESAAIKGMETGGMQAPKEPWQMTKRYHGTGKPIDQPPLQRVSSIQRVGRPQPLEFRGQIPETPTVPPVEPPKPPTGAGATGGEPPTGSLGLGEITRATESKDWLAERIKSAKEATREVRQSVKQVTAREAKGLEAARAKGGEAGYFEATEVMGGKSDIPLPDNPTSKANIEYIQKRIDAFPDYENVFEWKRAGDALHKLARNERPAPNELASLIKAVPELVGHPAIKSDPLYKQLAHGVGQVTGLMRGLQVIGDASAGLRQGILSLASDIGPFATNRGASAKAFGKAVQSLGDKDIAHAAIRRFDEHPLSPVMKLANRKVDVLTAGTGKITKSQELYANDLLHKIPGVKTVAKFSERHFTTTMNINAYDKYFGMLEDWAGRHQDVVDAIIKTGEVPDTEAARVFMQGVDDIGDFTNIIMGRGSLGALEKHAATLNTILYASKLMASRLEYVPKGIVYSVRNPVLRKEFANELVGLTALTLGILGAAKLAGASVEMDARSTDFGKIRVGDTRIDLMGGFQPYIRYTAQIMTGQRKSSSGRIYNVSRADTFGRFLRSKESPVVGLVHDVMTGSSFIGQDVDLSSATAGRIAYEKFTPLFIQDVYDAVKQEGATGAVMAAPGFVGATVSSYGPEGHTVKEYRDKVAQKAYGMSWEDVGRLKGKYYQTLLEETDAKLNKIVEKQRQEKLKAAGIPKTAWDRWYGAQQQITEDVDEAIAKADEAVKSGRMTPAQFRERVDDILSQARQARNWMETDPQYKTVTDYLATPSGKDMAIGDVAYNDYVSSVYDSSLTDSLGRYDYAEAESRKRAILQKYGADVYQYVQQRLTAGQKDEPSTMTMLRQARETLKPYWGIEDKYWQAYPQLKEINEQIKYYESMGSDKARLMLKRYPRIVVIRKRIAQEKQMLRKRNPEINQALIFYR